MIPPQELKNKSFARTGKGYDIAEVDEYIDFIIEKYSEIFAQCDKYDKKLRIVSSRIGEIQQEEETIHKLIISTQKNCDRLLAEAEEEAKNKILEARQTAEKILDDAREKARAALYSIEKKAAAQIDATQKTSDALLLSARTRCTKLLGDFKKEIAVQRENILNIKNISEEFNSKLLSMYKNHLNLLSENTYTPVIDLEGFTESKLFESVMREIKNDAAEIAKKNPGIEYDFEEELESIRKSKNSIDNYDVKSKPDNYGQKYTENIENTDNTHENDNYDGDDDDEDVIVFAKSGAGNSHAGNDGEGFDLRFLPDSEEEDIDAEKPVATYDSDDYEYEDSDNENDGGDIYPDEVYGIDNDNESDSDDDFADDAYDDIQNEPETKGFLGLFRKKKKKQSLRHSGRKNDDDDDGGDREDEVMDIFEDLDDNE